jgi:hypothetical protein
VRRCAEAIKGLRQGNTLCDPKVRRRRRRTRGGDLEEEI